MRESPAPVYSPAPAPDWLKFAYSVEFLVALQTILAVWSQAGGQGHMDLLPWYLKLVFTVLWAACAVRLTAAIVQPQRVQPQRSARVWLSTLILISAIMGCITFYYHAHEVPDEPDTDETSTTSVSLSGPAKALHAA